MPDTAPRRSPQSTRVVVTGIDDGGRSTLVDDRSLPIDESRVGAVVLHAIDGPASLPLVTARAATPFPPASGSSFVLVVIPSSPEGEHGQPQIPRHRSATVDYGVVLSGRVRLHLDDGSVVDLVQGDAIVQGGTYHAWHNAGSAPCVMAFCLLGAAERSAHNHRASDE